MSGDPNFSNVSLLVHCDGTNGSGTFVDASNNAYTLTDVNNPVVDTSTKKFGTGSMSCDGSALQYITAPISAAGPLDLTEAQDWTVEFWTSATGLLRQNILFKLGDGSSKGFFIQNVNPNTFQASIVTSGGTRTATNVATVSADAFVHIALVNFGKTVSLYVNGVGYVIGAMAYGTDTQVSAAGDTLKVGGLTTSFISNFVGFFDDIRVTKGLARYTTDFTPPAAAFADGASPSISVQPQSQSVVDPATATFSVVASGTGSLTYQWYKNSVSLGGGATSSSYTTPANDHTINNGDQYYVIVTNAIGSIQSDTATLGVTSGASVFAAYTDANKPFIPLELWLVMHSIRTVPGYNKSQRRAEAYRAQAAGEPWVRRDAVTKQYYARRPKAD